MVWAPLYDWKSWEYKYFSKCEDKSENIGRIFEREIISAGPKHCIWAMIYRIKPMQKAAMPCAPADAAPEILKLARYISPYQAEKAVCVMSLKNYFACTANGILNHGMSFPLSKNYFMKTKAVPAFFRLVRWPNLLFIALTQSLFYFCIIDTKFLPGSSGA